MKKVVLKLDIHDDKAKRKAMRIASVLPGLDSISVDMKQRSLTLTGDIDPVPIVEKLRKSFVTDVFSIAPVKKEPEEKKTTKKKKPDSSNDTKKEDPEKNKPEDSKKEQGGAPQKGKQDPNKKKELGPDHKQLVKALQPANPLPYYYYYNDYHRPHPRYGPWRSMEEDPNACVIC